MPELTITSPYVHSVVDSNTFTIGNPMPESTLTLCQSRLSPPVRDLGFGHRRTLWTVCIHFRGMYPIVLTVFSTFSAHWLSCSLVQYTECQAFYPVIRIGIPPTPSPVRECCSPALGSRGRHTHQGGGGGMGEPIPTMEQTLWYSRYT
jgi:hypothetical protein